MPEELESRERSRTELPKRADVGAGGLIRSAPRRRSTGRFPVETMMPTYDFEQIDQAAHDAEAGKFVKPVIRMR